MKRFALLPLVAFALAACSDATSPPEEFAPPDVQFGKGGTSGNPTYKSSVYSLTNNFGLNHSWRQTGMGNFTNVPYLLEANATITAHCENRGKNAVAGAPFQIDQALSSGPTTFPQRNGSINGSITLTPSAVDCQPPGNNPHSAVIDAVEYSEIKFCWGKETLSPAADAQGPVPGGPNSGNTVPPSPQDGTPLTGSEAGAQGIFAACVST